MGWFFIEFRSIHLIFRYQKPLIHPKRWHLYGKNIFEKMGHHQLNIYKIYTIQYSLNHFHSHTSLVARLPSKRTVPKVLNLRVLPWSCLLVEDDWWPPSWAAEVEVFPLKRNSRGWDQWKKNMFTLFQLDFTCLEFMKELWELRFVFFLDGN